MRGGGLSPPISQYGMCEWQPAESAWGVNGNRIQRIFGYRWPPPVGGNPGEVNGNLKAAVDRRRSTAGNDRRGLSKRLSQTGSSPEATPETTKSEMNCNRRRVGRVGRREAVSACDSETADLRAKGKALYLAVGP